VLAVEPKLRDIPSKQVHSKYVLQLRRWRAYHGLNEEITHSSRLGLGLGGGVVNLSFLMAIFVKSFTVTGVLAGESQSFSVEFVVCILMLLIVEPW
jgi:hypothetical protein